MTPPTWRPPQAMRSVRYEYIPMRDGVRLACDVFRPVGEGPWPALLVRTPYNKNGYSRDDAVLFTRAGYVVCVADARGTGGSEGTFSYYNLPESTHDAADCIAWLADRPFCDGQVGTLGGSALGFHQLQALADKPPALKALYVDVAPVNCFHDNWFPGGIFNAGSRLRWVEAMVRNTSPAVAVEKVEGEIAEGGDAVRRRVALDRQRLRDERLLAGKCPSPQDWMIPMRQTAEVGGIWHAYNLTADVAACELPVTWRGRWYDHFVRATCECYHIHPGPRRLHVVPGGQGTHGEHADIDVRADQLRWFDYWLKGIDNGVMDEPPVRLFVMGEERWRQRGDWPVDGPKRTLALAGEGRLSGPVTGSPAGPAGELADTVRHDPADPLASVDDVADIRDYEARALTYTSEPLAEPLTVVGEPVLRLRVAATGADAHVHVKLADVFPDGRSRQIDFGRLRAAHRAGHDRALLLTPGEPAELTIPLWPTANTFGPGHRVRVVLAGSDAPYAEVFPTPVEITVLAGNLELPVS